jgi:hypothetical protein
LLLRVTFGRVLALYTFSIDTELAKMHSFLFPEDITGPSTRPRAQQTTANSRRTIQETNRAPPPQMPSRAAPTVPEQDVCAPPPPTYAPPPIPMMKVKEKPATAISITELSLRIPDQQQEPGLRRSRSKFSVSSFKERREAKARAAATMSDIDVVLPPLSPVVDEEFWRTGRYPTSPGMGMVHVAF